MSTENFFWFAAFKVAKSKSQEFQNWMEKDHFPAIHKTGCVAIGWKKTVDPGEKDFDIILYRHRPMSKAAWEIYNTREDFRPKLRREFGGQWKQELENGEILPLLNMAGEEIYDEEETTNDA